MQDEDPTPPDASPQQADELELLRAENERLKAELADAEAAPDGSVAPAHRAARRRGILSVALIVIGSLLLPLAVFTVWTRNQVLDTDKYVATVAPLGSDPVIISALSNRISTRLSDELDVKSLATDALPSNAAFLAAPIAAGADNLIHEATTRLLKSEQFRKLWVEANRKGHDGLVAVLTGQDGTVISTSDGKVVISLGAVAKEVLKAVDQQFGIDISSRIPTDKLNIDYEIVDSRQLAEAQTYVRLLDRLSWFTVILALGFLIGGAFVGTDRRRGVLRVGVGIAVSMLVTLIALSLLRSMYLTNLPSGVQRADAAAIIFDTLTRFVQQAIRVIFTVGVVLFVAAWIAGPSKAATRVRHWWDVLLGRGSSGLGGAVDLGPVPGFVHHHVGLFRVVIGALAVATLLLWNLPTGKVVLLIAVLTLIPLALVQVLANIGRDAAAAAAPESALPDQATADEVHAG